MNKDKGVVIKTLAILIIVGILIVGIGGFYIYTNLQPVDAKSKEAIVVEIPMGSSVSTISSILKEKEVIKNEKVFYYYVRYKGVTGLQAGEYKLSPSMELDEIIDQLKTGKQFVEGVKFTVPEGLSVEQVAVHLEEKGLVKKDRFLQLLNEGDFSQFAFVKEIPDVSVRKYRLEGFLFPETYEIEKGASEEEIIRVMLRQFEQELQKAGWTGQEGQKQSLYDVIILASIVEREAILDEERPIISGVFHNRIEEGMLLQSCATVQFVLGKQRDRILFEDLEVESPYNTYIHEGLPPSPIASPGRESIKAALSPEKHDFLFFVTKKDGSGSHHFAKTYEEHLNNDAKSRGSF